MFHEITSDTCPISEIFTSYLAGVAHSFCHNMMTLQCVGIKGIHCILSLLKDFIQHFETKKLTQFILVLVFHCKNK